MKHNKEKFADKRKFGIPLDTFVETSLTERQISEIREWVKNGDSIRVFPYHQGSQVVLINATKIWGVKKVESSPKLRFVLNQ